jgi:hypothetical protein
MIYRGKKLSIILLIALFLQIMVIDSAWGKNSPKLTVLVVDRISITDLLDYAGPFLQSKIESGSFALMTTNSPGARTSGNTHATLGAGSPAFSDRPGGLALNFNEEWMGVKAGELYRQLTGKNAPANSVIIPRFAEALRLNFSPSRSAFPGLIGKVLTEHNFSSSVIGNSDPAPPSPGNTYYTFSRFSPWLATNSYGLITLGDVGLKTLKPADGFIPWESNYQYILEKYKEFRTKSNLLFLELGDFSRLDALNSYFLDPMITKEKKRLFSTLDKFLLELWPLFDFKQESLIFLSPTPANIQSKAGNLVTPLIAWGEQFIPGLLISPTTRRPGIIANIDLASTIFKFFNITTPTYTNGRPFYSTKQGTLQQLVLLNKNITKTSIFRRKTIPFFLNLTSIVLPLLFSAYLILEKTYSSGRYKYKPWLLSFSLSLSILPFSLHVASQFSLNSLFLFLLLSIILDWLLTSLSVQIVKCYPHFILPIYLTVIIIFFDLITGNHLIKNSIFGYDPMLGARYYGIGNEISGLFLGGIATLLITLNRILNNFHTSLFWSFLSLTALLLAAPFAGSNFGAGLTAFTMALAFLFLENKNNFSTKKLLKYLFFLLCFGVLFLSLDFFLASPNSQTHFGFLLENLRLRGITALKEIVLRKMQVNIRLLSSKWSFLTLSSLTTMLVAYFYRNRPFPITYLYLILVGGFAGLFFNDSGLVCSALLFYLPAPICIYYIILDL